MPLEAMPLGNLSQLNTPYRVKGGESGPGAGLPAQLRVREEAEASVLAGEPAHGALGKLRVFRVDDEPAERIVQRVPQQAGEGEDVVVLGLV